MSDRSDGKRRAGGRAARIALRAAAPEPAAKPVRPGHLGGQYRPIAEDDMARIHRAAVGILETTGLADPIPSCTELVTAAGGWHNDAGRLCFPPALVEDTLAKASRGWVLHGHDPAHDLDISDARVHFGTAGAAVEILDIETRTYRETTLADLYDMARLIDTLEHIHWCLRPVVARDMETTLDLDVNTAYAVMTGTAKPSGLGIISAENVPAVIAMFDAALGGEGMFRKRPFAHVNVYHVVPPLRFAEEACRTLEAVVRAGVPILIGSAGQAGATSPAALAGTVVQTMAEALAGLVYANLISPGHPVLFAGWPAVSDLRTGALSGGGGEQALLTAAVAQMGNFYGLPCSVAAGLTDSKVPDAQAGFEKGSTITLAGLAGANMVHEAAGMLASVLGTALECFVIDNDMLGNINRAVRGIEVTDETLSVDVIDACATGPGHFLGHPQTLGLMQSGFVYPRVSDRTPPAVWDQMGRLDIVDRARDYVRETLRDHYPSHIGPDADARVRARFNIRLPREFMVPGNGRW